MPYKDPEKAKAYAKKHYEANKNDYKRRARKFTKQNRVVLRDWIWEYLLAHPCVDCNEKDPIVLQFDHQRDKEFDISTMTRRGLSLTRLKKEVEKCEVRCANCHMRRTVKQLGWWTDKRAVVSSNLAPAIRDGNCSTI